MSTLATVAEPVVRRPELASIAAVDAWLAGLPKQGPAGVRALIDMLVALASSQMPPAARITLAERLRPAALARRPGRVREFLGKALPLAPAEQQAWLDAVELMHVLVPVYEACLAAFLAAGERERATLACQRAISAVALEMLDHAHACRVVPAALWKSVHRLYACSEANGFAAAAVPDPSQDDLPAQSCADAYRALLLVQGANLNALSAEQIAVVAGWARRWSGEVALIAGEAVQAAGGVHAIDLASAAGPRPARDIPAAASVRRIGTAVLGVRLRELAASLREGRDAPEFAAAAGLPRLALERLLTHLYIQWCGPGTGRLDERRTGNARAQAALDLHGIHFQVSGRAFRQPGLRYTREEEHDLAVFGHITERTEHRLLTARSSAQEPWEVVNQSQSGLLGLARRPGLETRLAHGQLVALRTSSTAPPVVGTIQRLRFEDDASLAVAVRIVAGEVRAAAVRPVGAVAQKFERALVVCADETHGQPASLIVEPGRFRPGTTAEVHITRNETVRIESVMESGVNFERLAFRPA